MAKRSVASIGIFISMFLVVAITCFQEERSIYLVLLEGDALAFHDHEGSQDQDSSTIHPNTNREASKAHTNHLLASHDLLLQSSLENGSYNKLHSYKHIINGFSVHTTPSQAARLRRSPGVKLVEKDRGAKMRTTYTPEFLSLRKGIWAQEGGERNAGEGVVIGFVDSGINALHPSFAYDPMHPFSSNLSRFEGACETGPLFPPSSCNGKIVAARFFSAGAEATVTLNASMDFLSPFDADGHGSHVASVAAGNAGVSVVVNGFFYGKASGMAPRARIAVYKAIFPSVGTLADVIAAIDQAVLDGVDILSLSVGPNEPPESTVTFLSMFDISLLFARKAGVFVVQAAGNKGPASSSVVSFSPWSVGVAACTTDRRYPASLLLGNGSVLNGAGLSGPTFGNGSVLHKLVLAKDAVKINGTTQEYIEECQHPEVLDPNIVLGSIIICTFSTGFNNGTSTLNAIIGTSKALGLEGFILVANPNYGDYIAEPIPFAVSGIMIPRVDDAKVILQYYEEQIKRDRKGTATEFGAMAAVGEGRVASFTGRSPIVSRFSSRGPDIIDMHNNLADVLKPDILAPGHQIWAAWTPISALEPMLKGHDFALLSGTSMSTPHVAGIAALIKQYNPLWTPAMIASAISTTSSKYDNLGEHMMAEGFEASSLLPSTPFEYGAGFVSPNCAIDPGLVLSSGM
ncbi:Subtilisin-like protease SBT2.4 isoform B [Glycine soja]|uniref:Subtilisin-like protease SBT2.4 isoform B n=1 Tax=Glycine soja TaxID=3848 RepID=A0A445K229_GLYSO|nr:Subtilisin-like protease SBT2.4 isoform B [Glycine soja]